MATSVFTLTFFVYCRSYEIQIDVSQFYIIWSWNDFYKQFDCT